jgi:hypothetical protein
MSERTGENGFSRALVLLPAALVVCLLVALAASAAPALAAGCTKVASPSGSDSAAGSDSQPFRTAQKLVDALGAGDTGCLRAGTYSGNVKFSRSGEAGSPITITSYPAERATIAGKLWVTDSANFVTVASLDLDGRNAANLPSPAVNGDDVTFTADDVTNYNTTICFNLGPTTYGRAYRTLIENSRIHNCGALPATNFDHGIYVEHTTDVQIVDNLIYDNADRGIQLYPDAQSTYIARNVIDGNGEGVLIGGGSEDFGPQASSDNVVEQNIITFSNQRSNVESHWGSPLVGERNTVRNNCVFGGARDDQNHGLSAANGGFTASNNLLADPGFVNRAAKNFSLRSDSPCRDLAHLVVPADGGGSQPGGGPTITLTSATGALQPGGAVPLSGQVKGGPSPSHVTLRVRRGKHWKRVARLRVRSRRFAKRVRLHGRRSRSSSLRLSAARLSGATRVLRLQASAPGFGHSNVVLVRVAR